MGGPKMDFCAGRLDFVSNEQTLALGPSPEQERFSHCDVDGECGYPLGQNTLGLIYVNPEGPLGEPDPQGAADTVRDVFSRVRNDMLVVFFLLSILPLTLSCVDELGRK